MNRKRMSPVATILIVAGASMAAPETAQDSVEDLNNFELADTDGNGCVSWEEMRDRAMVFFDSLDFDGDGIVTVNEHLAAIGADTTDEDGEPVPVKVVDPARHQASLRVSFNLSDRDDSGCLESEAWEND
jgi:Ca2+-binding EF-hand superfamily protein